MGMFDTLYCDYPLPDKEVQHEDFQTKSLDRLMDTYRITTDGRLYYEPGEIANNEESSQETDYLSFEGTITFYTMIHRPFEPPLWVVAEGTDETQGQVVATEWYEYLATFRSGIVTHIIRTESREKGFTMQYLPRRTFFVSYLGITNEMVEAALAGDRRLVLPLEK